MSIFRRLSNPTPHLRIRRRLKQDRHPSVSKSWPQWFLKQGDAHPLKAIGIVATIIVFGSAMLLKEAWTAP